MNEFLIFQNKEFGVMRTMKNERGEPLFCAKYCRQGLAKNRTIMYHNASGEECTRQYMVWTEAGRNFIHQLFNR